MSNYDNEVFSFENKTDENMEQENNFYYNSINGLGESNYENEDLFDTEITSNSEDSLPASEETASDTNSYNIPESSDNVYRIFEEYPNYNENEVENSNANDNQNEPKVEELNIESEETPFPVSEPDTIEEPAEKETEPVLSPEEPIEQVPVVEEIPESIDSTETKDGENNGNEETPESIDSTESKDEENNISEETPENIDLTETKDEESSISEDETNVTMSETPIEELKKLTEYTEEKIDTTDIGELFEKVNINVKDASDIFKKNTDLKKKIDSRFEELKKLQSEIENTRKNQVDEINQYKEEVLSKLTEKKEEIEKRLNILKEAQSKFEKERQEFEQYRKKEQENIEKVQKEVQEAYDSRREELGHIEDVLRKQKDALDEERNQLSLDRIEYESDKNELANNLLKFNDIVNSFTSGVDDIKE